MRQCLVLLAAFGLTGCTLYSSDHQTHYADAEGRVPQQLFSRLEQQTAGKPWLLKQLGQPQAITRISAAQNAQVYTWAITRKEISEQSVLLLYKSQHTKSQQSYLHIVFGGDAILKHWLDRDAQVDTTVLLASRDLKRLELNTLEQTSYSPPERPVVTQITPTQTSDESQ